MSIVNPLTLKRLGCQLWWPGEKATANLPKSITANGNATQVLPFPGAGIGMFDGTGDYISVPNAGCNDIQFGSSDFTIEGWMYIVDPTIINVTYGLMAALCNFSRNGIYEGFVFYVNNTGYLTFSTSTNGTSWTYVQLAGCGVTGWHHIAAVRYGSSLKVYWDGIGSSSVTISGSVVTSGDVLGIAGSPTHNIYSKINVSEFRISKGIARYTSNFTPPRYQHSPDKNTVLLLHFDRNDSTFIDASGIPKTITAYGDAKCMTPAKDMGMMVFDGATDYITAPNADGMNFNADFTIECWFYSTKAWVSNDYQSLFSRYVDVNNQLLLALYDNTTPGVYEFIMSSRISGTWTLIFEISISGLYTHGALNHIAVVRYGSQITLWINGKVAGSVNAITVANNTTGIIIGCLEGTNWSWKGGMSEYRISNVARYTAPFVPPRHRLSRDHNTLLLIHGNSNSTTFTDDSAYNRTITKYGDVKQITSPCGAGLMAFDGTGDYLTCGNASDWNLGTSLWTIEFDIYLTSYPAVAYVLQMMYPSGNQIYGPVIFSVTSTGKINMNMSSNGTSYVTNYSEWTNAIPLNTWTHVTIVRRADGYVKGYYGIVENYSYNLGVSTPLCNVVSPLYIGYYVSANPYYFKGYLSEWRISKDVARTVSIPTVPYVEDDNTILLLHGIGTTVVDSSAKKKTVTAYGNAKQLCSPVGSGVAYFDGTGDYLLGNANVTDFDFGSGDFTIQCLVKFNSVSTEQSIVSLGYTHLENSPFVLRLNSNGSLQGIVNSNGSTMIGNIISSAGVVSSTTDFYNIVFQRSGSVLAIYLNGVSVASGSISGSVYAPTGRKLCIGVHPGYLSGSGGFFLNGYISEIQVSSIVRSVTVLTTPFKPDPYTKLLLHMDGTGNAFYDASDAPNDNGFVILPDGVTVASTGTFDTAKCKNGCNILRLSGTQNIRLLESVRDKFNVANGNFTFSAWIFVTGSSASANTILNIADVNTSDLWLSIYISPAYIPVATYYAGSAYRATISSPSAISLNTWYHIAYTRNNSTWSLYINGILAGTATYGTNHDYSGGYYVCIGNYANGVNYSSGNYNFRGMIRDALIIKGTALSHEQINQIIDETFIY